MRIENEIRKITGKIETAVNEDFFLSPYILNSLSSKAFGKMTERESLSPAPPSSLFPLSSDSLQLHHVAPPIFYLFSL